jgi:kynureninase
MSNFTTPFMDRSAFLSRDKDDPLRQFRDEFALPADTIYLDGNSLGALPRSVRARLQQAIDVEWGDRLITSWLRSGWMDMPRRIGDKIARLIGAADGEVVVADSTSINVYKALAAALARQPERRVILSTPDNFPTDLYMAQGLIAQLGGRHELRLVEADALADHLDEQTAVLMLTHVDYRSGRMHDMAALTRAAHAAGALTLWDLAHSAGAVEVDLNGCAADLAVGCGYKFLNGGPGAPAFLFVAQRHQDGFRQPLSGWLGHAQPFAFDPTYTPAVGITRGICGTPPVLSMTALECGVDLMLAADIRQVRRKSLALSDAFLALVEQRCAGFGLRLATPTSHTERGSQASYHHPHAYEIMQALIAASVVGDFRAPDILRFGFTPLYTRFVDVWDAVDRLHTILRDRTWDRPEYSVRKSVT